MTVKISFNARTDMRDAIAKASARQGVSMAAWIKTVVAVELTRQLGNWFRAESKGGNEGRQRQ